MHIQYTGRHNNVAVLGQSTMCPFCGTLGTFTVVDSLVVEKYKLSFQVCPNSVCKGIVVMITNYQGQLIKTYPGVGVPINGKNVPEQIMKVFAEAVGCCADGHYTASAIMIRRTLEEICAHQEAKGHNLQKRIEALKSKVLLPAELLEAMHELRLLGNDAAHIEAASFAEIGRRELEVSITFTQEIIKALYQYESLLADLRSFKKAAE